MILRFINYLMNFIKMVRYMFGLGFSERYILDLKYIMCKFLIEDFFGVFLLINDCYIIIIGVNMREFILDFINVCFFFVVFFVDGILL